MMKYRNTNRIKNVQKWLLYYPYVIIFSWFKPEEVEVVGTVGVTPNGEDVLAASAIATFKRNPKINFRIYMLVCRKKQRVWGSRILSSKDFFAYKMGAVEEAPITDLVNMRLV